MGFVEIYIVTPDGDRYKAEVDEDADADTLLLDLLHSEKLQLPIKEQGKPIEYSLKLVNALRLRRGVTVEIARVEPKSSIRNIKEE